MQKYWCFFPSRSQASFVHALGKFWLVHKLESSKSLWKQVSFVLGNAGTVHCSVLLYMKVGCLPGNTILCKDTQWLVQGRKTRSTVSATTPEGQLYSQDQQQVASAYLC